MDAVTIPPSVDVNAENAVNGLIIRVTDLASVDAIVIVLPPADVNVRTRQGDEVGQKRVDLVLREVPIIRAELNVALDPLQVLVEQTDAR